MLGTAFFVKGKSFITAAHIINERPQNSEILYHILVPDKYSSEPIPITILLNDLENDICIGEVEGGASSEVHLADISPQIGTSVGLTLSDP